RSARRRRSGCNGNLGRRLGRQHRACMCGVGRAAQGPGRRSSARRSLVRLACDGLQDHRQRLPGRIRPLALDRRPEQKQVERQRRRQSRQEFVLLPHVLRIYVNLIRFR
ncbi:MAG TPA: hypothetical protein VF801_09000, partial [Rhodocyclaceae bacterium]